MASDILAQFVTLSSNPASEIELILATSLIESLFKNVTQNASVSIWNDHYHWLCGKCHMQSIIGFFSYFLCYKLLNEFFQIIDNIVMVDQSILQMAQETGNVSSRLGFD